MRGSLQHMVANQYTYIMKKYLVLLREADTKATRLLWVLIVTKVG